MTDLASQRSDPFAISSIRNQREALRTE